MHLTTGSVVAERFRLVRKLGEGGMGAVWLSHHVKLDTPCAVKFIHAEVASAAGVKERFEREAKVAAQIRSPHVVQVLDYGVSEDVPYIAMEYLDGEDLAARLSTRGRLSPAETVAIVAQVARALTKAHAAGLVHRDLKPENVFLVKDDDGELVKVLDFGIAKAQAPLLDGNTRTGTMLGTPRYMSPEQAQGVKAVDHRSDLWSLAVITYRSVVGHLPFDSDALGDLLMRIMVHPLPVPSLILPGLPKTFDAWWARGVARDPADRFQSAKELAEALAVSLGMSTPISGHNATPLGVGGPTPPAVAGYSPVPFSGHTPPPTVHAPFRSTMESAPHHTYASGPSSGAMVPPASPYVRGNTTPSSPPMGMPPVDKTMSPASHTYGAATAGRRKGSGAILAVGGLVGVAAIAAVAVLALRGKSSDGPAASSTAAATTAVATTVAAPPPGPSIEPATVAPDPVAAAADPAAGTGAAKLPVSPGVVKTAPRPLPTAKTPPAPARTGKVKLTPQP